MRVIVFLLAVLSICFLSVSVVTADDGNFGVKVNSPNGTNVEIQNGNPPPPASPGVVEKTTVIEKSNGCSCQICR